MNPLDQYALSQREQQERVEKLNSLLKEAAAVASDLGWDTLSNCLWDSADDMGEWLS